jgi:hypothetical protein
MVTTLRGEHDVSEDRENLMGKIRSICCGFGATDKSKLEIIKVKGHKCIAFTEINNHWSPHNAPIPKYDMV